MGGFFGAVSRRDCVLDIFFGADYHSHLGTRRGGMVIYDQERGFQRQIHNIENTPFRTKFEKDIEAFRGCSGIGCISDTDPQPLLVRSHLGLYAIAFVGIINNAEALVDTCFSDHGHQFMAMSSGKVNQTELVAALISQKETLVEGIRHAQELIDGSATILLLTPEGILAARDGVGRLPILVGKGDEGCCVSFESFAYHKLGYADPVSYTHLSAFKSRELIPISQVPSNVAVIPAPDPVCCTSMVTPGFQLLYASASSIITGPTEVEPLTDRFPVMPEGVYSPASSSTAMYFSPTMAWPSALRINFIKSLPRSVRPSSR